MTAIHLTRSEQEVMDCISKGWDCPHIADWLGIAPATVRVHVVNIAAKLEPYGQLRGYRLVLSYAAKQSRAA